MNQEMLQVTGAMWGGSSCMAGGRQASCSPFLFFLPEQQALLHSHPCRRVGMREAAPNVKYGRVYHYIHCVNNVWELMDPEKKRNQVP